MKIVPEIVVATEVTMKWEEDDDGDGSPAIRTNGFEEGSVASKTGSESEDFMFPLLSWRTYVGRSFCICNYFDKTEKKKNNNGALDLSNWHN